MAYEGLDVPEVAVVAALTHIRSRPWLEQMVARATRVDFKSPALTRPSVRLCSTLMIRCFASSGSAWRPSRARWHVRGSLLAESTPPALLGLGATAARARRAIIPLESNALAIRFSTLRPGPDLAMKRPEQEEAQSELIEAPSVTERRLRARIGELVAAQAVEDEAGRAGPGSGAALPGRASITAIMPCLSGSRAIRAGRK